ncbi:hypothetical protein [Paenibacillus polymyxa]|uniref:hypothetical protein n=1 Tax=Paenibacillus TaxID=44249 RepID=UPI0019ED202C|nr:hypothetical protein [Paenibacillus polymyxa]KAF6625448.1 hypothetical protein H6F38_26590 [Paenibacillus sp. EKM208P]URJ60515.3 hypothetical protein MF622_000100 [Paenibacillus polymyxa]
MRTVIKEGWALVRIRFYIVIILFLYRLLWGVFLYRLVQSAVIPLLLRYPDQGQNELGQTLFWMESQIALMDSREVHVYLWILLGATVLRILITPFIRAGIYQSLHTDATEPQSLSFFKGMKRHGMSSLLYYTIELGLLLLPAFWVVPRLYPIVAGALQSPSYLLHLLPYVIGWMAYGWFIRQCILYMQLGTVGGHAILSSLLAFFRQLLPAVGISLLLGACVLLVFGLFGTVAMIWTGMLALILQQSYHFVTSLVRLWHISSQYRLWHTDISSRS